MTIRLDRSDRSTVTWCDECPWWSEVYQGVPAALRACLDHEREYHPDDRVVAKHYARELAKHAP